MTDDVAKLTVEALALPFEDRVRLIESVMSSLDGESLDTTWRREFRERLVAYRMGGIEAQDFSDYLRKYEVK